MDAAGPGDDLVEDVGVAVLAGIMGDRPRFFWVVAGGSLCVATRGKGESGMLIMGSMGQLLQKNRRGLAASCMASIAAASLVILGELLLDLQSLLAQLLS
jgi:hypothetical protein